MYWLLLGRDRNTEVFIPFHTPSAMYTLWVYIAQLKLIHQFISIVDHCWLSFPPRFFLFCFYPGISTFTTVVFSQSLFIFVFISYFSKSDANNRKSNTERLQSMYCFTTVTHPLEIFDMILLLQHVPSDTYHLTHWCMFHMVVGKESFKKWHLLC